MARPVPEQNFNLEYQYSSCVKYFAKLSCKSSLVVFIAFLVCFELFSFLLIINSRLQ